ncbi:MAG: PSD1 and planctomycete cytochrome C domain-containing protein [Pirellulales bacterium]
MLLAAGAARATEPAAASDAAPTAQSPGADDAEHFERRVRPLLIERCGKCHGDMLDPEGGLSLTSREAILKGGANGPAAVAGQPGDSLLIKAVRHDGLEMPPEGERLSPVEVAALERWVERGLAWPKSDERSAARAKLAGEEAQIAAARASHWAFQPVRNPPLPAVRDARWPQTPIDHFVLARLDERGLTPSPAADKRTLLRRLTFDFHGLPPTPEEIDAFLADAAPGATERAVDRLLASPRYGEHWGRHWLDVARYADTKGYILFQDSNFPWSYTYRDYVVRALNEDLPYDRFVLEQLAADKLPLGRDKRALTALGFLTLGSGFMNNQQDVIDDRVDVVTRGLLGLTVSCARCHDHKYDAIPTRDYYSLYGVFASCAEPTVPPLFEEPPQTEAYQKFAHELAERERKLREFMDEKFRAVVDGSRLRVAEYLLAAQALADRPPTDDFMLLADPNDPNPTMIIRYQLYLAEARKRNDPLWTVWHALAALPPAEFSARAATTVEQLIAAGSSENSERPVHPLVAGAFLGQPLKEPADAARIYAELLTGAEKVWQAALEAARSAGQPAPAALADANLEALRLVFHGNDAPAMLERNALNELMLLPDREGQNARTKLLKDIEDWRASGAAAPPRAMVLEDLPRPAPSRVFVRGNPSQPGEEAPRRFLRVLTAGEPAPFGDDDSGRLELAQAICARDNPLTARVIVNRVWLWHFGQALVATPSDFGVRSERPTHPELLDYLAWNFMEHGWSLKWLHREIALSAAYQQSSVDRAECRAADPENKLLWRANRRRLDFEATRDALLAVAGRLGPAIGGAPVKDIAEATSTRRTLYGHLDRLNLPGLYRTFDFPNPDATSPERSQTTIPQQALFLLNHPLVQACAKHMLGRPEVAGAADADQKITRLYRLAYGRAPQAEELEWGRAFVGESATRPAVWEEFAQGLLVANEFVFVD